MGVFLTQGRGAAAGPSLPHARGGVSHPPHHRGRHAGSSPRTWGCFYVYHARRVREPVFPTHVGVFPVRCRPVRRHGCLPHARGGVSAAVFFCPFEKASSPRTWGCFCFGRVYAHICNVFPTHVGVFLRSRKRKKSWGSLPHARGGVSQAFFLQVVRSVSSPRTWGCFCGQGSAKNHGGVFPTHVGVFLRLSFCRWFEVCLPHARGGVSISACHRNTLLASSPRTWGCFYWKPSRPCRCNVFPTHVGVFLHEADRP